MVRLPCAGLLRGDDVRQAVRAAEQGRVRAALELLDRVLVDARAESDLVAVGTVLGWIGVLLDQVGRRAEARVRLQAAISLLRSKDARKPEQAFVGVLAEMRAEDGDIDAARRALEVAEGRLRELGAWTELGSLLVRRALVEILAGDLVMAVAALEDARDTCASEQVYDEIDRVVASLHVNQELAEVA